MLEFLQNILIILFMTSVLGYAFVVIKEKQYLKNNIILIDNPHLKQEDLDKTDMKEFYLNGNIVKSGDVIKVLTTDKEKIKGIIIGAKESDKSIFVITYKNEVIKFKINNILKFKVTSKYGRFFN